MLDGRQTGEDAAAMAQEWPGDERDMSARYFKRLYLEGAEKGD
jgi:hypothetical protein